MKVAVVGTGYVGLVTGCCLSDLGHVVTCIDKDINKIQSLKNGIIPIYEPGLEEVATNNIKSDKLFFTTEVEESVNGADVIFIAVGTPMADSGEADLKYVYAVANEIAPYLKDNSVVAVKSTVPVGTCDTVNSIISDVNGSIKFSVVSNPEFLREGSAIKDATNPDRIVIGSTDLHGIKVMKQLYEKIDCPIIETDLRTSEMIKYAANGFLATKISFINALSVLCEKLGADVTMVSQGMGLDKRIGTQFLNAGIGYGGSCFPKDVKALIATAKEQGYDFNLLKEVEEVNASQKRILLQKILKYLPNNAGTVGILGLAFKPHTDDMREAPSISIIHQLQQNDNISIKVYDPIIMDANGYFSDIAVCKEMYELTKDVDVLVLMTEWPEFLQFDWDRVAGLVRNKVIIDARNVLNPEDLKNKGFVYEGIGRN